VRDYAMHSKVHIQFKILTREIVEFFGEHNG
ncbi:ParA family protein, partial [Francisella tularensis subsp. holarctica]|nr:ParA family protein [Francisella tularensis subsp. holarctica]